jgi:hypothetical protein
MKLRGPVNVSVVFVSDLVTINLKPRILTQLQACYSRVPDRHCRCFACRGNDADSHVVAM